MVESRATVFLPLSRCIRAAATDSMVSSYMALKKTRQLVSYIAPAAPARRRPAAGDEPFLRPDVGFTPNWYRTALGIDFGARWHTDPDCRRSTILDMRAELKRRFGGTRIGDIDRPDSPLDILTGTFGISVVPAIYGIPIIYTPDNWPDCERRYLSDEELDRIEPPDLETNPFFRQLMAQVDRIADFEDRVEGFLNWQGVLNNAHRLRGEKLFFDLMDSPQRCRRLFECIVTTMIDAAERLHRRQRSTGVENDFITVSNCLVNMISPQQYREFLFPLDVRLAEAFGCIGIHNCSWNADPYIEDYARVPHVGYIDMGLESNLSRARELMPAARRALIYRPTDLANKPLEEIREDLERLAREYAPCDVVVGDIEAGTPDERVLAFIDLCDRISRREQDG